MHHHCNATCPASHLSPVCAISSSMSYCVSPKLMACTKCVTVSDGEQPTLTTSTVVIRCAVPHARTCPMTAHCRPSGAQPKQLGERAARAFAVFPGTGTDASHNEADADKKIDPDPVLVCLPHCEQNRARNTLNALRVNPTTRVQIRKLPAEMGRSSEA